MEWLGAIGLAFNFAGAMLLIFPILTPPRWSRGLVFPQSAPTREALAEVAYTEVGFVLMGVGFALQLAGFVVSADPWWLLLLVGTAVVVILFVGGGLFVGRYWLPVGEKYALAQYRKTQAYREDQEARRAVGLAAGLTRNDTGKQPRTERAGAKSFRIDGENANTLYLPARGSWRGRKRSSRPSQATQTHSSRSSATPISRTRE